MGGHLGTTRLLQTNGLKKHVCYVGFKICLRADGSHLQSCPVKLKTLFSGAANPFAVPSTPVTSSL